MRRRMMVTKVELEAEILRVTFDSINADSQKDYQGYAVLVFPKSAEGQYGIGQHVDLWISALPAATQWEKELHSYLRTEDSVSAPEADADPKQKGILA